MCAARGPGQRAGLTREQVLDAAAELVDHEGLGALTMRGVASRLGVAPNALYSHVAGKEELLDGLLDGLLADLEEPAATDVDPRTGLHDLMLSTYRLLLTRPDLVPHYLARQGSRGPHAVRLGRSMVALMDRMGVREDAARHAVRVLVIYTIGFAAVATPLPTPGAERPLSETEAEASFEGGLAWLLEGISRDAPQPEESDSVRRAEPRRT